MREHQESRKLFDLKLSVEYKKERILSVLEAAQRGSLLEKMYLTIQNISLSESLIDAVYYLLLVYADDKKGKEDKQDENVHYLALETRKKHREKRLQNHHITITEPIISSL